MSGISVKLNGMGEFRKVLKSNVTMDDVKRIVKVNGDRLNRAMKTQTTKSYVKGYSTGDTASIRLNQLNGIRFYTTIDEEKIAALNTNNEIY